MLLHLLKFAPAVVCFIIAGLFVIVSRGSPNDDDLGRAMAGIFLLPAIGFGAVALLALVLALIL